MAALMADRAGILPAAHRQVGAAGGSGGEKSGHAPSRRQCLLSHSSPQVARRVCCLVRGWQQHSHRRLQAVVQGRRPATAAQEAAGLWHMDTPSLHSDGCPHHVAANFSDGLSGFSSPIGPTWVILAADTLVPHRWLLVAGARQQHPSSTGSPCSPGRLPAPSAWQVSCPAVAWCIRELSLVLRGPIRPAPISRPSAAGRVCELVCELQVNDVTNEPELTRVG